MEYGLSERVAIVSGGSKGIGRAIAALFAREGARVVIAARGAEALDAAVAELDDGGKVIGVQADMTRPEGIEAVVSATLSAFGRIDIAVSNVYPLHTPSFEETSDEQFREEFENMVMSVIRLTRAVTPIMKERGFGRLINIGGLGMKGPVPGIPLILSDTVRPAVVGLSRSLSHSLAPFGITMNSVAVGFTMTERMRRSYEARAGSSGLSRQDLERERVRELAIPAGRLGTPEEVAALVGFFASESAGYVTGQTVTIDGGFSGGLF